jgi:hypothetical protein
MTARLSREEVREKLGSEVCETIDRLRDTFGATIEQLTFADGTVLGRPFVVPDPAERRPLPPRLAKYDPLTVEKPPDYDQWLKDWRIAHAKTLGRRDPFFQDVVQRYGKGAL